MRRSIKLPYRHGQTLRTRALDLTKVYYHLFFVFFFSSRRRHTRCDCDWSSDVCSSDLLYLEGWRLGLKNLAIYRDNCKVGQPLSADKKASPAAPAVVATSAASAVPATPDRKSTRLNSSHSQISYAVFCLKKKTKLAD